LRFKISARAPLGTPNKSTGRFAAVCTKAINVAEVVSEVIIQAAATSLVYMQMLATSHVDHRARKTGNDFSGANHPGTLLGSRVFMLINPILLELYKWRIATHALMVLQAYL